MPGTPNPPFVLNSVLKTEIETIRILDIGAKIEGEARYARLLEHGLVYAAKSAFTDPSELYRDEIKVEL